MDSMDFTIPKKGSQQQQDQSSSLPASSSETAVPQVATAASKPPPAAAVVKEKRKTSSSRPSSRGRLLPSAVNSKRSYIHIKSEDPFIIKINLSQVPLKPPVEAPIRGSARKRKVSRKYNDDDDDESSPSEASSRKSSKAAIRRSSSRSPVPPSRSSSRGMKRKSSSIYVDDGSATDTDDLMTSGEEAALEEKREKRRIARKKKKGQSSASELAEEQEEADLMEGGTEGMLIRDENGESIYDIEGPPNGTIGSLWYSREQFLHVFVIEKILAWKTRPVVNLECCEPPPVAGDGAPAAAATTTAARKKPATLHSLEYGEAMILRDEAIVDTKNDFRKRMEVSRINPGSCPHVKKVAAKKELNRSKKEGLTTPSYKAVKSSTEREEVFLVKWRGRSYLHCSWERKRDLEKYDHSSQAGAARGKISRYMQNQALAFGQNWKKVLEDERKAAAMPGVHHSHHLMSPTRGKSDSNEKVPQVNNSDEEEDEKDQEDYFSPLHLEVERILGCDESELDMNVLYRQRAINLRDEQEALKKREEEDEEEERWLKGEAPVQVEKKDEVSEEANNGEEKEWDPEDNVRYIVRWKGLQLTDITWEYWADIKRDFVDEVEDFWLRQKAPTPAEVNKISKAPHPHPKDFKKMNESPIFGVSSVERPIAKLDGEEDIDLNIEKDPGVEYKLRGYQLEGVNWLKWNWYNKRSCILADEMGLGALAKIVCCCILSVFDP